MVEKIGQGLALGSGTDEVNEFFQLSNHPSDSEGWYPTLNDIELGFRIVPLVIALRTQGFTSQLKYETYIQEIVPGLTPNQLSCLRRAGLIADNDAVTLLGDRVFARAPGPYGIIHAYHSYMAHHTTLLKGQKTEVWVSRGANVVASQQANAKTFHLINESLSRYCEATGFDYDVYIEHAVGQGEATRQHYKKHPDKTVHYFGADLEEAAIARAEEARSRGELPADMRFVRRADIGEPEILIDAIMRAGCKPQGAVMVVGNGFHEVRNQSNEKMIQVFKKYCDAGILVIFTEESALSDEDLLATGWNTYHAGFRYFHAISGQGLRPAIDDPNSPCDRLSWHKCASLAGYEVNSEYTTRTRTIYPYPRKNGTNPAISVNYFCIPRKN